MKILLFTTSLESAPPLVQEIKKTNHLVMETIHEPNLLIHEIARTTPHLLVVHAPKESIADHLEQVSLLFPELPVCMLSGTDWQPALHDALAQPIKPEMPRPYAEGNRFVCHDASLRALWSGKLNRPALKEGWEKICSRQEARFVLQLQTARKNHEAARRYFQCLITQQAGLDQELAYRLAHGSYKALSWSRDLVVKWLALLAHYVPGVELEYLPIAGTPGPAIDYVHHDLSMEGTYAAALIFLSKVKPTVDNAIQELITARFEKQDDDALLALSLKLYGTAKFLEQVGKAQIELMDAWLDLAIVNRPGDRKVPRGENRHAGIYRDFYDLTFIINSPEPLDSILRGFHAGTTYVEHQRFLPTFAEFHRLWHKEKLPSNQRENK